MRRRAAILWGIRGAFGCAARVKNSLGFPPGVYHVGGSGVAECGDGLFFGERRGSGGDGDFLCAGFISADDLHVGDVLELAEGGGDVVFAACADHAGHLGDVGVGGFCSGCERGKKGGKGDEGEVFHGGEGINAIESAAKTKFSWTGALMWGRFFPAEILCFRCGVAVFICCL